MSESPAGHLDEALLLEDLRTVAFAPSVGPPHVGLEVEQLSFQGIQAVPLAELLDALEPLITLGELEDAAAPGTLKCLDYGTTCLTFEPGGQLEIVSPPRPSVAQALQDVQRLETLLDGMLTWRGIRRANHGMTPWQGVDEIDLQTPLPRYQAMHSYFSSVGDQGVRMMRLCCALQINIDSGPLETVAKRWRLANLMSPILIGMFANSPMAEGRVTGWKSTRADVVARMDPGRTGLLLGADGPSDYLRFALNAGLMLRRTDDGYRAGSAGWTFGDWMRNGDDLGFPTLDDWHYHLTTLFPMVRPRGFLELRAMDTAPERWRSVPVAIATSLLIDEVACATATGLLEPHIPYLEALAIASAQDGLGHPLVRGLAQRLTGTALECLPRLPSGWVTDEIIADVHDFNDCYTARGRCPADDLLDLHRPASESAQPSAVATEEARDVPAALECRDDD